MELFVKLIDISTGDSPVVLMTRKAAITYDLHTTDRVVLSSGDKSVIATVNTTANGFGLHDGQIGMFQETALALGLLHGHTVKVLPAPKPESIKIIRRKMEKHELTPEEIRLVVDDIVARKLTQVELTYFVAACSINPLSFKEIASLTRAMSDTGVKLHFNKKLVIDKHCIGGVPGNRTSMITVPIMAALGYTVPKTSSRAITSPAGTADTLEVLTEVNLSMEQMLSVVRKTGACLVWGGGFSIAPADDRIIRIERPLSIDVPGLLLSSVMAKKYSAGSTHVVIDIPYGATAKIKTKAEAEKLREQFLTIGKLLGMHLLVLITDGSQPIGNGIGPLLEAYDVLAVLKNDQTAPQDLRTKSLMIAGELLEFIHHCPKGKGRAIAEQVLTSGKAYEKFQEIIDAQGRKVIPALAKYHHDILAEKAGVVASIDNIDITKIARIAGAPISANAGLLLYAKVGDRVVKGEKLFTIYVDNEDKLKNCLIYIKNIANPYSVRS
jgi:thymidine phosphorylase